MKIRKALVVVFIVLLLSSIAVARDIGGNYTANINNLAFYGNDLAAAKAAIGSDIVTIEISKKPNDLTGNLTVSENITLDWKSGAALGGAFTLTLNGGLIAGPYKIFEDDLNVAGKPKIHFTYAEWFGAVGDGVVVDTVPLQAALDLMSIQGGKLKLLSKKYLSDTLRAYTHASNSFTDYGDVTIEGTHSASYAATQDTTGSQIIHVDGSANPIIESIGVPTADNVRNFHISDVLLVGGTLTTDLVYIKNANDFISLTNVFGRVKATASNGINLESLWTLIINNVRVYGTANGTGVGSTGTGLIVDTLTGGLSVNQCTITNFDSYKFGTGRRFGGTADASSAVVGPITVIGGQSSTCDGIGTYVGHGAKTITFLGSHDEQNYGPGMVVNNNATSIKVINHTFSNNGINGTSYNLELGYIGYHGGDVAEIDSFVLDGAIFFSCVNGIKTNIAAGIHSVEIKHITFEPKTNGVGIGIFLQPLTGFISRVIIDQDIIYQPGSKAFATDLSDANDNMSRYQLINRIIVFSANTATIDVTELSRIRLANTLATNITDFTAAYPGQQISVSFSNILTTLKDITTGGNFNLAGSADFTPSSSNDRIVLEYFSGKWYEVSRSIN